MKLVKIENFTKTCPPLKVKWCESFIEKFRGLMFTSFIREDFGILLVEPRESIINTAIHMFFMNFDIACFWINSEYKVVDKVIAKKWHPAYFSKHPAQYVLETNQYRFADYSIGDQVIYTNEN